ETGDVVRQTRDLSRPLNISHLRVLDSKRDVSLHRVAEKKGLLRHVPNALAQLCEWIIANVDVVNENRVVRRFDQTWNLIGDSRLSAASTAHKGNCVSFGNREIHVFENRLIVWMITKSQIAKFNLAFDGCLLNRSATIRDCGLDLKNRIE